MQTPLNFATILNIIYPGLKLDKWSGPIFLVIYNLLIYEYDLEQISCSKKQNWIRYNLPIDPKVVEEEEEEDGWVKYTSVCDLCN